MKSIIVLVCYKENFGKTCKIYKLNDDGDYFCSIVDPKIGFSMQEVVENANIFYFFESLADANMFISNYDFDIVDDSMLIREYDFGIINLTDANAILTKRKLDANITLTHHDLEYNVWHMEMKVFRA